MSKPRALPDRPGIIQRGCESNMSLFYEEAKGGENYRKKKQVQERRKTARQV